MTTLIGVLIGLALYFIPTIVAVVRRHQMLSVGIVNVFFGWTALGWIIALVMAVRDKSPNVVVIQQNAPPAA